MDLFEKYYDENNLEETSEFSQCNRKQLVIEADYMHDALKKNLELSWWGRVRFERHSFNGYGRLVREPYLTSRTIAKPSD